MDIKLKSLIIRSLVIFIIPFYFQSCAPTKIIENLKPEVELETSLPQQQGLDPEVFNRVDSLVKNHVYPNIHSVVISKNNKLVFEKYYEGKDQIWGRDQGFVDFNADSLHDIRSISKSITSACIGIVLAQGKIRSVDQRVFDFFPEYNHLDTGFNATLTIKHLLTMTTGQKWNEDISYADTSNSERRMTNSKDPVQYSLSQPYENKPGTVWNYNGGSTQVLAAIIEKSTGKQVDEIARDYLFSPLGINRFEWIRLPYADIPAAASGLRMKPGDMLKFGMLYINNGKFNSRNVLTANWVKESIRKHISGKSYPGTKDNGYGYQFWIETAQLPVGDIHFGIAVGNGNQRIFIDEQNKMVVVITAGNYNIRDIKNNSDQLVYKEIYAALPKR